MSALFVRLRNRFQTLPRFGRVGVYVFVICAVLIPTMVMAGDNDGKALDTVQYILLWISGVAMAAANMVGKLVAMIINLVLVPVMQYNGFTTSKIVGAGWTVVRDAMNMGFIVALIVIAMVTIFGGTVGSWSVKWQSQIPKLLLFAILINFSRLICGLLIDVGQVVMLTFVNAVKDIAGGNIIQLFGMSDIVTLDTEQIKDITEKVQGSQGIQIFDLFAASMLALIMMLIILGTMLIMMVILIYRIVMLWVLTILSPLAFFFGGAKGIFPHVNAYADWWSKFTSNIAVGPVLAFFLWLALTVAGTGNLASAENFPIGSDSTFGDINNVGGFITNIAESGRMLSFILGIGILFAGFEAASQFSSALPGMASSLVKGGPGRALRLAVGGVAGTAAVGVAAGGFALKGASKVGGIAGKQIGASRAGQKLQSLIGTTLTKAGGVAQKPVIGGFAIPGVAALGRAVAGAGSALEHGRKEKLAERMKEQGKRVEHATKDEIDTQLATRALTADGVSRQQAARMRILTDSKLRKEYAKEDLEKVMQEFLKNGGEDTVHGDETLKKAFSDAKKQRVDILPPEEKKKVLSKMSESELLGLDEAAYLDESVIAELGERKRINPKTKQTESYLDAIKDGRMGSSAVKQAVIKQEAGEVVDVEKITDGSIRGLEAHKQTETTIQNLAETGKSESNPVGRLSNLARTSGFQMHNAPEEMLRNKEQALWLAQNAHAEALSRLAKEDKQKAEAFVETLNDLMEQYKGDTSDEAKKVQDALREARFVVSGSGAGMNVADISGFDTDEDLESFRMAARRSPTMLLTQTADIKKRGAGSDALVGDEEVVANVIRSTRRAKGKDREAYIELLEAMEENLKDQEKIAIETADIDGWIARRESANIVSIRQAINRYTPETFNIETGETRS